MSIRSALIGCGNISKYHVEGILAAGGTLKVVCDIDANAAEKQSRHTGARVTSNWKEAVDADDVDVVHITVLSHLHREIATAALGAGKSVICEKTLSESKADSLEILRSAKGSGQLLFTSYMKRYLPSIQQAFSLLKRIGTVTSAKMYTCQPWGNVWDSQIESDFFRKPADRPSKVVESFGGGILHCGGSHILDLLVMFFGRPQWVCADMFTPPHLDYELRATALIGTADATVQFESVAHPLHSVGLYRDGWHEGFEICGTLGSLSWYSSQWDAVETKTPLLQYYDNTAAAMYEYRYSPVSPFSLAIQAFYQDIASGVQQCQDAASGYEVDTLIETFQNSARTAKRINVHWEE